MDLARFSGVEQHRYHPGSWAGRGNTPSAHHPSGAAGRPATRPGDIPGGCSYESPPVAHLRVPRLILEGHAESDPFPDRLPPRIELLRHHRIEGEPEVVRGVAGPVCWGSPAFLEAAAKAGLFLAGAVPGGDGHWDVEEIGPGDGHPGRFENDRIQSPEAAGPLGQGTTGPRGRRCTRRPARWPLARCSPRCSRRTARPGRPARSRAERGRAGTPEPPSRRWRGGRCG